MTLYIPKATSSASTKTSYGMSARSEPVNIKHSIASVFPSPHGAPTGSRSLSSLELPLEKLTVPSALVSHEYQESARNMSPYQSEVCGATITYLSADFRILSRTTIA
jgi:hypothetical protein